MIRSAPDARRAHDSARLENTPEIECSKRSDAAIRGLATLGATVCVVAALAGAVACSSWSAGAPGGVDAGGDVDGGDAATPSATCELLLDKLETEIGRPCATAADCRWTRTPLVDVTPFCGRMSVHKDVDDARLAALADDWSAAGCVANATCAGDSQDSLPVCRDHKCEVGSECERCDFDDVSPVCGSGANAHNACAAEHCLMLPKPYASGVCPDTPACTARGGTCVERAGVAATTPVCPSGTRVEGNYPGGVCAGGTFFTHCCVPWDQSCTHLPWGLSLLSNPFECGASGSPQRVCIEPPVGGAACESAAWTWFDPFGNATDPNVQLTVTSGVSGAIQVSGRHATTGRTFRCTGTVSWDTDETSDWSCQACTGNDCRSCQVPQAMLCPRW